jgi:hypothetical protein
MVVESTFKLEVVRIAAVMTDFYKKMKTSYCFAVVFAYTVQHFT